MGTDDRAVVDPELRVRGIEGLRIADASVFPLVPSSNIHPAVLMLGRTRGGDHPPRRLTSTSQGEQRQ